MDERASCGGQKTAKTTFNNPQTKNREIQPQSNLNNTISPNGKSSKFPEKTPTKTFRRTKIQSWPLTYLLKEFIKDVLIKTKKSPNIKKVTIYH